jgi:hypothetical protein
LLETVVAKRISKLAEEHNILPDMQMGSRPGRFTLTTQELLVEQIRAVSSMDDRRRMAMLLSLDISGAFDNVSREMLIHNLRGTGIPDWIGR